MANQYILEVATNNFSLCSEPAGSQVSVGSYLFWGDLFASVQCLTPWPGNFQPVQKVGTCRHTLPENL